MAADIPSIYLATPCYGGQAHAIYMSSLLALRPACAARGVGLHVDLTGGEALIGRARAAFLAKFIESPATHLLFIDADIGFEPRAVFRLLKAGRDVIGGLYPRKRQDRADGGMVYEVEPLPEPAPPSSGGFRPVASIGAGFLMISRPAARRMVEAYPHLVARLGDMHALGVAQAAMVFDSMIDPQTGRYLPDHQAFCHRWRALGGEVWADMESGLRHVGELTHA
ncbi:hypothetical protein [Phenylobacterium sp.]|uniref:hypothetical protein n=1 Tax=Phenylobacterium sp. TaxID=1871053 RepID=UPI002E34C96A|nr:hypothetical protein [Phenylobacterium sp.]HEX4710446.1 hypothetical protein [Phenylobacterium sp.]